MAARTRVRTPTVIQMEAVECGAAALAMVLGSFGRFVPLEELRVACGVSRDGSKALNVVKAARAFGLLSKGYKKEPAQLRDLPLPLIAFWNFNHFVVVEGFQRGKVYLNDPAHGPRVVSDREFDESFTGVVLVFEKGPDFQPGGEPPSVVRALRRRLPGVRLALVYAVLATLALVLPGMVLPVFSRVFVDTILVQGSALWVNPVLIGMALTALVSGVLTFLQQRGLLAMEIKLATVGSSRFFWHVLRLPMEFFAQRFGGDIVSRIEINDTVATLLSGELATNLVSLLLVGVFAALMFQYDVVLTLLGIGDRPPQPGGAAADGASPARCQRAAAAGAGQAGRYLDGGPAEPRDAEGVGRRVGVLQHLGRLPGARGDLRERPRDRGPVPVGRSAPPDGCERRGRDRARQPPHHGRRPDDGHAARVPDVDAAFRRAREPAGGAGRSAPGSRRRHEPPGRRAALRPRSAGDRADPMRRPARRRSSRAGSSCGTSRSATAGSIRLSSATSASR